MNAAAAAAVPVSDASVGATCRPPSIGSSIWRPTDDPVCGGGATPVGVAAGAANDHQSKLKHALSARFEIIDAYSQLLLQIAYDQHPMKEERTQVVLRFAEHDAKCRA